MKLDNKRTYKLLVEFVNEDIDLLQAVAEYFNDNKTKAIKESLLLMQITKEKEDPTSPFKCVFVPVWDIAFCRFCTCKVCK